MANTRIESFIFDARPHYPLLIPVKRYWHSELASIDDDAVTLILAHATSFHNEQWEPILEDIFGLAGTASSLTIRTPKIRDAWAIGCPNHGDGGILNEETLVGYGSAFSWAEYGRAIYLVLAGLGKGIDVDFGKRKLVGIGHSMGGIAIVLTRALRPIVHWHMAVLVEPMLLDPANFERVNAILTQSAPKRRDVWLNRETAHKQFFERSFKSWDPRCVELYVRHGLRDLPSILHPDKQGVTLKCTKISEEAAYKDGGGREAAQLYLPTFCLETPTHAVFGAIADVLPASNRETIVDKYAQGHFKSVTVIENAGHLVAQQNPAAVAERLYEVLLGQESLKGKL